MPRLSTGALLRNRCVQLWLTLWLPSVQHFKNTCALLFWGPADHWSLFGAFLAAWEHELIFWFWPAHNLCIPLVDLWARAWVCRLVQTSAVLAVSWVWLASSLICSEVLAFNSDDSAPTFLAVLRIVIICGITNKCYTEFLKYTYINFPS